MSGSRRGTVCDICNGILGDKMCFSEETSKCLSVLTTGHHVHEKIHCGTGVIANLHNTYEKVERIGVHPFESKPRLEQRSDTDDDGRNAKNDELNSHGNEHFGDADLFVGQTGGSLAAPPNCAKESDSGDDGSYQHDGWTAYCQTKPVKYGIHSMDHGFVPEVILVDGCFPGHPLRAHLVEAGDFVLENYSKSQTHERQYRENNDKGQSFCRNATLSSHGEQNADASFDGNYGNENQVDVAKPEQHDDTVVDHVPVHLTVALVISKLSVDSFSIEHKDR